MAKIKANFLFIYPVDRYAKIATVFRTDALSDRTAQKWFKKSSLKKFNLREEKAFHSFITKISSNSVSLKKQLKSLVIITV